ncbi:TetR/AcrR family transcriptional regulator [Leuconostoc litchii]|nr:TetR/AcrR family transcriptional regulator [Leuconostoc litchii]
MRLLETKTISKITVKEICDEAIISKSTFYDHYIDKYDVIDTMVNQYAKKFNKDVNQRFEAIHEENTFEMINKLIKETIKEDFNLSILMSQDKVNSSIREKFHQIFYKNAQCYFRKQKLNKRFSVEFLSQIYADLALTSVMFTLRHANDAYLIEEQTDFMNLIQSLIIDEVHEN